MSKRSVQKVRHYAPAPTVSERVAAGHNKGELPMKAWHESVPRYQKVMKEAFLSAREESDTAA